MRLVEITVVSGIQITKRGDKGFVEFAAFDAWLTDRIESAKVEDLYAQR